jgi:hypothetical protein
MRNNAEYCRLQLRFETLAAILRQPRYASSCRRTIAYWTSITDQSVPYALLDFTVHDVLRLGLESVASAPGVGIKKLNGLVHILERVHREHGGTVHLCDPAAAPWGEYADSDR